MGVRAGDGVGGFIPRLSGNRELGAVGNHGERPGIHAGDIHVHDERRSGFIHIGGGKPASALPHGKHPWPENVSWYCGGLAWDGFLFGMIHGVYSYPRFRGKQLG